MPKSELKTKVEIGEYKGNAMCTILELDDKDKPKPYPLLNFGIKKAEAILANIDEIKKFVEDNK
jgi:hypothetical protein